MAEQNNQQKKGGQQQDVNQLIQVRYDKLHELQANGKNPFEITKYDVTHHSTDIKDNFESLEGQEVTDEEGYSADLETKMHQTIKKVSSDFENLKYNTAIAAMMSLITCTRIFRCVRDDIYF